MKFLKDDRGIELPEWVINGVIVLAVVASIIAVIANSVASEGSATDAWINNLPAPTGP
jgi:hypothetical protein